MRKILLIDARPDLAEQLVDKSLLSTLGVASKDKVRWRCEKNHEWNAAVTNRVRKNYGCPYCSGRLAIPGETDLKTLRPDIAEKLVDKSLATQLKVTSHAKVEWQCEHGHVWKAAVSSVVKNGSGCPYCSKRRILVGETDLATTHPELAKELVDKSLATHLKAGTNKKVEWKCSKCGYVWLASPNTRTHMKSGCPRCAGKVLIEGQNDLVSQYPEIAAQMVDQDLAKTMFCMSNKVVQWRCKEGHVWDASISSRTKYGQGCPYCSGQRIVVGKNDLVSLRPDLVKELEHPEDANGVHVTSHKIMRWKCDKGHVWDALLSNRVQFGYGCPVCDAMRTESDGEAELADFVASIVENTSIQRNDRSVLGGRELDVFLPSMRVAFEYNGTYWHSLSRGEVSATKHLDKMFACQDIGIHFYTIWDDDWQFRRQAVKDYIAGVLGVLPEVLDEVIVTEVSYDQAVAFCTEHSLDRTYEYSKYIGVVLDNELICVIGSNIIEQTVYVRILGQSKFSCVGIQRAIRLIIENMAQNTQVYSWTDNGYESATFMRQIGFSVCGLEEPVQLVCGNGTNNCRIYADSCDTELLEQCHVSLNSGKTKWLLTTKLV